MELITILRIVGSILIAIIWLWIGRKTYKFHMTGIRNDPQWRFERYWGARRSRGARFTMKYFPIAYWLFLYGWWILITEEKRQVALAKARNAKKEVIDDDRLPPPLKEREIL